MNGSQQKTLLVTGAFGFVGRNLCAMPPGGRKYSWRLVPLPRAVNLCDSSAVTGAVHQIRPDAVLHLAANSSVGRSFTAPAAVFNTNFWGTYNLLAALRDSGFSGRVLYVSSAEVYGEVAADKLPITESISPRPRSPYAVSKVAAEALCTQWMSTEGMQILIARPFNHIGPGQDRRFAVADFAAQLVAMQGQLSPAVLTVGDVDVTRDFLDVRDVIRAYICLLEDGIPGEIYNICSGTERTIRSVIEGMARLLEIEVALTVDPKRLRPSEQRRVVGDSGRLRNHTVWSPRENFDETLTRTLNHWKESSNA